MRRGFWVTFLLVLLGVGFLFLAGTRLNTLSQLRRDYSLEPSDPFRDDEALSDLRIPTVALFTFRSLAIDYLWVRADTLKNDGQYFDALHLARAICTLQPNLPSVWSFNAWNMAYNISVAMPTPQERWHWVQAGYKLLRDEAIPYNRRSAKLYQELSWIFQHKIGGITDDWHRAYKLALAVELSPLIGENDIAAYEALAESPRRWDEPSCPAFNVDRLAGVQGLIFKLRDSEGGVSGYLRERFSSRTKRMLAEYQGIEAPSVALVNAIVLELNQVLVGRFNL